MLAPGLIIGAVHAAAAEPAGGRSASDPIGALIADLGGQAPEAGAAAGRVLQVAQAPGAQGLGDTATPAGAAPADSPALRAEQQRLFQQLIAQPDNLDLMFAYARTAAARGDYDQAIATYERMLILNPNLPRVRLELGSLYYRLGAFPTARGYFDEVLNDEDVPPTVRRRIEGFLAAMNQDRDRSRLFGTLFFGMRYQTNPGSLPGSGTEVPVSILPGFPTLTFELEDADEDDDFSGFAVGSLRHFLTLDVPFVPALETNANVSTQLFVDNADLDTGFVEVNTGPVISVLPRVLGNTALRPFLSFEYAALDFETYFWSWGGGANLRHEFTDRIFGELIYEHLERDYHETDERPFADERDGSSDSLEAQGRFLLDDRNRIDLIGYAENFDAEVDWESFDEFGGRAVYTHLLPSPVAGLGGAFELFRRPWVLSATLAGRITDYDDPDPVVAPDTARHDEEYRLAGGSRIGVADDWDAVLQLEYRDVSSNIGLYDFDNFAVTVGALWRFQ